MVTSPSRNASALAIPSAETAIWSPSSSAGATTAKRIAAVSATAARLSIRILLRATLGWSRPARQSLYAAIIERDPNCRTSA